MALGSDNIEFDVVVNGEKAKKSLKEIDKEQEKISKTSDRTTKNITTNWKAVGLAAAAAAAGMAAMMKSSIELERALFGLNKETKEWIKNASEQYGMSQQLIAGFVQSGKAAGLAGDDIQTMIDQAIALGRAYPHESTESFIDNLIMLNRTGEAQGFIVDVLEQKYGLIDLKTLSLAQKQEALNEATKGVNEAFNDTSAAEYDKTMQGLVNTASSLGSSLVTLANESGAIWTVNKVMEAGALAATGYALAMNRALAVIYDVGNYDTSELDASYEKLVKLSDEKFNKLFGGEQEISAGTIVVKGTERANIVPQASPQADKERAMALAASQRFWDEYNQTIMTATEYELTQLSERYNEYAKHVDDKVALEEWFASEQKRIIDETNEYTMEYKAVQERTFDDLASAMTEFATTGTADFKAMAQSIIEELIRIQIKQMLIYSFTGASGASMGGGLGSVLTGLFAKGAAFSGGDVTPFANGGVVNSPTVFPMANGMGLMGEAGAEAIMPLTRTSGGDLGVKSSSPVVNVNVQNYGNDEVNVQQNGDNIDIIISRIANDIQRGTGDIGSSIESRYGVRKV